MTTTHPCRNQAGDIDHDWARSQDVIGFVGTLYPSIYPLACKRCKAVWHKGENKVYEAGGVVKEN